MYIDIIRNVFNNHFNLLQINIELASDSKDFTSVLAKTRLAEMTNPKIVPIPQPRPKPQPPKPIKQSTGKDFEGRASNSCTLCSMNHSE